MICDYRYGVCENPFLWGWNHLKKPARRATMEVTLANESLTPTSPCSPLRAPQSTPFGGRPPGAMTITHLESSPPVSPASSSSSVSDCLRVQSVRMLHGCSTAAPAPVFSMGDASSAVLPTEHSPFCSRRMPLGPSAAMQTAVECCSGSFACSLLFNSSPCE